MDEERQLYGELDKMGLKGFPKDAPVAFDWARWQSTMTRNARTSKRSRRYWIVSLALLIVILTGLPLGIRTVGSRLAWSATPWGRYSQAETARFLGVALGDPFLTGGYHWTRQGNHWIFSAVQYPRVLSDPYATPKERQLGSYRSVAAVLTPKNTRVVLGRQFPSRVVLGPAPRFAMPGKTRWVLPFSLRALAERVAFFSGHPNAMATAQLTNMRAVGLTPWWQIFGTSPGAVLMTLKAPGWHRSYVVGVNGLKPLQAVPHVVGYQWSWQVAPPTMQANLGHTEEARILQWAQKLWGTRVTGDRWVILRPQWTLPLTQWVHAPMVMVQFNSAYGSMSSPVLFNLNEDYVDAAIPNWRFTTRGVKPSDLGSKELPLSLTNGFPSFSMLSGVQQYGTVLPNPTRSLPPPYVHWSGQVTGNQFVRARIQEVIKGQQLTRGVAGITITAVKILQHSTHTFRIVIDYTRQRALWSYRSGPAKIEVVMRDVPTTGWQIDTVIG